MHIFQFLIFSLEKEFFFYPFCIRMKLRSSLTINVDEKQQSGHTKMYHSVLWWDQDTLLDIDEDTVCIALYQQPFFSLHPWQNHASFALFALYFSLEFHVFCLILFFLFLIIFFFEKTSDLSLALFHIYIHNCIIWFWHQLMRRWLLTIFQF